MKCRGADSAPINKSFVLKVVADDGFGMLFFLNFDWTPTEATKPLKITQKLVNPLKKFWKTLTLSIEEIRPNWLIQIGDDFNSKNICFDTPTQED